MDALRVEGLEKRFGDNKAIDGLTFSVPEHSVFGLVGLNGAGKTTTMRLVLGLLKADKGSISVFGESVRYGQTGTNRLIGCLPDVPEFYGYMKPKEYLGLCGEITGMDAGAIRRRSETLLSLVGLDEADRRIGGFSRGMKQRLGIAQALLNEPRLLLCDEPTSALDPVGRKEILDILSRVRGTTTVVFSTHILFDVERICDRIAVLHKGKLALSGTLESIRARHRHDTLLVEFASQEDLDRFEGLPALASHLDHAQRTNASLALRSSDVRKTEAAVIAALAESGILPVRLERMEPTLETLFMEAVG